MHDIALLRAESVQPTLVRTILQMDGQKYLDVTFGSVVEGVYRATVNGVTSPSVGLTGPQRALIGIPPHMYDMPLGAFFVWVYADVPVASILSGGAAAVGMGPTPTEVPPDVAATQAAIRTLMMDVGSDPMDPSRGGGLRRLLRRMSRSDVNQLRPLIINAVETVNKWLPRGPSFAGVRCRKITIPPGGVRKIEPSDATILTQGRSGGEPVLSLSLTYQIQGGSLSESGGSVLVY